MSSEHYGECEACGARLIWALTPTGKRAPVDAQESQDGTVLVLAPPALGNFLAVVLSAKALEQARAAKLRLRTNHFATCEHAEQFRKLGSKA